MWLLFSCQVLFLQCKKDYCNSLFIFPGYLLSQTAAPLSQVKHIFPASSYSDRTPPQGEYFVGIQKYIYAHKN